MNKNNNHNPDQKLRSQLAEMIRKARQQKGFTQQQLAQLVGTQQPSIARIESGKHLPSLKFLRSLAEALGTELLPPQLKIQVDERKIAQIAREHPQVKLAYLFGSQADRNTGPLSDYDIAFYLDLQDQKKAFRIKIDLINQLSKALQTDNIDVVILNTTERPELKYNIIQQGKLLYEEDNYGARVEPDILNRYFDFRTRLKQFDLIKE